MNNCHFHGDYPLPPAWGGGNEQQKVALNILLKVQKPLFHSFKYSGGTFNGLINFYEQHLSV